MVRISLLLGLGNCCAIVQCPGLLVPVSAVCAAPLHLRVTRSREKDGAQACGGRPEIRFQTRQP